jgi:hypothetical protein
MRNKTAPTQLHRGATRVPPLLLCPARIRRRESPSTRTPGANSAKRHWSAGSRCPCISRAWWRRNSADATRVRSLICPPTQDHGTRRSQPWPRSVHLSTNSTTSPEDSRVRRPRSAARGAISRRACASPRTLHGARTSSHAPARHASPFSDGSRGHGGGRTPLLLVRLGNERRFDRGPADRSLRRNRAASPCTAVEATEPAVRGPGGDRDPCTT